MLKSTLNSHKPSEPKRPTLPHLFKDNSSPMVVLFTDEGAGAVVKRGCWPLGHFSRSWASCRDAGVWTPLLPGESVTITVESED